MNESIRACYPALPPMVGYALTSTFRSMSPPAPGDAYAGLDTQVAAFAELPGPAVVVFQDLDQPVVSATFGEVMCTVYQSFGAAGLITSGAGRDLEQVAGMKFPCFNGGTICAHGYCHTLAVNVPSQWGASAYPPGDLLHGDLNGVTTIPVDIVDEIPQVCEELAAAEKIVLDYCRAEGRTPQGLAEARKACSAMMAQTAARVRRDGAK